MKNLSNIMTEAHKIARTLEGDYSARLAEGMRIAWNSNDDLTITSKKDRLSTYEAGTHKQLDYLQTFPTVEMKSFSHKKWSAWFSKKELSNAIQQAKEGKKVIVNL